jgi:hypothetical protein
MIPDAKIVSSVAYYCEDPPRNTWVSPNAFPIPRPNILESRKNINERRHPTWWDEKRPWLPYIPVFDLSGNAHHELFSVSRADILSKSLDNRWSASKEKIMEWIQFYEAVKKLCIHVRNRTRLCYSGTVKEEPPEVDYQSLKDITGSTHHEIADSICLMHDGVREWIGYFSWLWLSRGSEQDPLPYSSTLSTPPLTAFIKFLGQFSQTLRGVCIDFSLHPASELHIKQWQKYHVPIHILLKRVGNVIREVPDYLTINGLGAILYIPKHYNKLAQYAIDQNPSKSPSNMYMWEPPKSSTRKIESKRQDYIESFLSFQIHTPRRCYQIMWYRQKIARSKGDVPQNPMAILEDDYNEIDDEERYGTYISSDESEHERHLIGKRTVKKLERPPIPALDFQYDTDIDMNKAENVDNEELFSLEPMAPADDVSTDIHDEDMHLIPEYHPQQSALEIAVANHEHRFHSQDKVPQYSSVSSSSRYTGFSTHHGGRGTYNSQKRHGSYQDRRYDYRPSQRSLSPLRSPLRRPSQRSLSRSKSPVRRHSQRSRPRSPIRRYSRDFTRRDEMEVEYPSRSCSRSPFRQSSSKFNKYVPSAVCCIVI